MKIVGDFLYFYLNIKTMKIKPILLLGVIVFAAISATIFIRNHNDHKECNTVITSVKSANGSTSTETTHVCHEQFSF